MRWGKFIKDKLKFDIPILQIVNGFDSNALHVLVEPHLALFEVPSGKTCDVYYVHPVDNPVPEKTLSVAQRDDYMVV